MGSRVASTIRRALLYVPASSTKFLEKSRTIPTIDNVTYDLEDSVTPDRKPEARKALRRFLEQVKPDNVREVAVRINSVDSGHALEDLREVLQAPNVDALVIPKVNSPSDLHFITDAIRHLRPERHSSADIQSARKSDDVPIKLLALVESARSITDLSQICRASPYLDGLIFAAEDFALDLSITRTPSLREFLFARSSIVTAAKAHGLPSAIDLVSTQFRGEEGMRAVREESEDGKRLGFNGKQCIHPTQAPVAQEVFGVSASEAEWAVRVVIADEKAQKQGRGAWTLDGKMIDAPVASKARGLVQKAEVCEMDVQELRRRFKDQEPE